MQLVQNKRPDLLSVIEKNPDELGLIPAWSYSTLKTFETCPYRSYISKVKRIREDYGPAAHRGTLIHTLAEEYVQGKIRELPKELNKFTQEFEDLREFYTLEKVELEGDWGFTIEWEACGWLEPVTWARIKLDAMHHETETSARVIDYKTGKMYGNEIAHAQQAIIYAVATFFRYPKLEHVQTEVWYLDHGEITKQAYTRNEAMMFMPKLHQRALAMTTATKFPPSPSKFNCNWCSYKNGDDPICQHGIK